MPNTSSLDVEQAAAGKSGCHFNSVGGAGVQLQAIGPGVEQWSGKWVWGNWNSRRGQTIHAMKRRGGI